MRYTRTTHLVSFGAESPISDVGIVMILCADEHVVRAATEEIDVVTKCSIAYSYGHVADVDTSL